MTTALIADDEPLLREALARQLAQVWPELQIVAEARNGREAIKRFDETKPEVTDAPGSETVPPCHRATNRAWVCTTYHPTISKRCASRFFAAAFSPRPIARVGRRRCW